MELNVWLGTITNIYIYIYIYICMYVCMYDNYISILAYYKNRNNL
ncbi:MAG: hypothetical protein N7Q72_04540 [Spiroplasma sp. Tabriz.8]|nr:hypothetical protein [Spiroplasma sp. Tabriz.8]